MKYPAAALFLLAAAASASAQDERLGARARYWYAQLNGSAESSSGGSAGTVIDLDQELGLDDIEPLVELEAWVKIPILGKFSAGYWAAEFTGERSIGQQITFDGVTFPAGTLLRSDLDIAVAALSYEFVLPSIPLGDLFSFEIGLLLGLRYMDAEARVSDGSQDVADSGDGGLPVVGGHVTLLFGELVRLEGMIAGLAFDYSDTTTAFVDAYLEVSVSFGPIFAGVGYRYVTFILEQEDDPDSYEVDVTIDGFYLSAGVRF